MDDALIVALAVSPFIGSFLGVVADRLPQGESFVAGRSYCRSCASPLGWAEMIPLLSYAVLRGRCRHCGGVIPPDWPALELGALGVALWAGATVPAAALWPSLGLGWALLVLAAIDLRDGVLPAALTGPLTLAGLAANAAAVGGPPVDALIGAAVGWGFFAAVILLYRFLRGRDGMGWGDAALLAAGGAWTGWAALPQIVLIAALTGLAGALAFGRRRWGDAAPFGPALGLGIWATWLYGGLAG